MAPVPKIERAQARRRLWIRRRRRRGRERSPRRPARRRSSGPRPPRSRAPAPRPAGPGRSSPRTGPRPAAIHSIPAIGGSAALRRPDAASIRAPGLVAARRPWRPLDGGHRRAERRREPVASRFAGLSASADAKSRSQPIFSVAGLGCERPGSAYPSAGWQPARPRYKVDDRSILLPFYRRFLVDPLLPLLPARLNPNTITHVGHLINLVGTVLLIALWPKRGLALRRSRRCCSRSTCWCDNADGAHARRTNQCSALGEFLDHGLDQLNTVYIGYLTRWRSARSPIWWVVDRAHHPRRRRGHVLGAERRPASSASGCSTRSSRSPCSPSRSP